MSNVIIMMIGVSLLTFFIVLGAFLWAVKNKQFDDEYKFITLDDDEEESLNDMLNLEKRKEEALRKQKKLS